MIVRLQAREVASVKDHLKNQSHALTESLEPGLSSVLAALQEPRPGHDHVMIQLRAMVEMIVRDPSLRLQHVSMVSGETGVSSALAVALDPNQEQDHVTILHPVMEATNAREMLNMLTSVPMVVGDHGAHTVLVISFTERLEVESVTVPDQVEEAARVQEMGRREWSVRLWTGAGESGDHTVSVMTRGSEPRHDSVTTQLRLMVATHVQVPLCLQTRRSVSVKEDVTRTARQEYYHSPTQGCHHLQ